MKVLVRSFSRLASVLVLTLTLAGTLAAQSVAPSGSYGFLLNATAITPVGQGATAILGVMDFDGVGNASGSFTQELWGTAQPMQSITGTLSGTYSSNPDGTGSISVTADTGDSFTFAMVITEGGHGLNLVATSCSCGDLLTNAVLSGVARHKRRHTLQSVAALQGSYGGQFSKSPQPTRDVVVLSFDGAGNIAASTTSVHAGEAAMSGDFVGTYTVNPDETGTITLDAIPGVQAPQTFVFVITDGGSGLLLLQTHRLGDGVSYGTARRQ